MILERKESDFEHTEDSMINLVANNQTSLCTSYEMLIPNCYTQHDNEADILAIRKSGICDEFEIKISRSDFFNDAKKIVNYRDCEYWSGGDNQDVDTKWLRDNEHISHAQKKKIISPWQKGKYQALKDGDMTANYFWYVIKEGEVSLDEIPDFAGVIFVTDKGEFRRVRMAKKLHNKKINDSERYNLVRKLGFRFWDYRLGKR